MMLIPSLTVVLFFTIVGLGLVVGRMATVRYWSVFDNLKYVITTTSLFTGVGIVCGLAVGLYSVRPSPFTFVGMGLTVSVLVQQTIFREMIDIEPKIKQVFLSVYTGGSEDDAGSEPQADETSTSDGSDDSNDVPDPDSVMFRIGKLIFSGTYRFVELGISVIILVPFFVGVLFDQPLLYLVQLAIGPLPGLFQQNGLIRHHWSGSEGRKKSSGGDSKNVLLYIIDDVRRDRMSLYGYNRNTTPFLDSIRDELQIYSNVIAPGTRSGHSIPSMLSGTPATIHKYFDNIDNLSLLPEEFANQGYLTGGISGNPHMSGQQLMEKFDWYMWSQRGRAYHFRVQRLFTRLLARFGSSHIPVNYSIMDTDWMVDLGTNFIQEATDEDRPFFLYLHPQEVHESYVREQEHIERFVNEHDGQIESDNWTNEYDFSERRAVWYESNIKNWGYDETIQNADKNLQRLYTYLEQKDLLEETVIVVTSDHGELLGERGLWGHIDVPYNRAIEVPLLIRDPDRIGTTVDQVTSGLALPSLIFDAANITPSEQMQSQWFREGTVSSPNTTQQPALVDLYKPMIRMKGYDPEQLLSADANLETDQILLVDSDWKLHEVDGETWFYRYDDDFLDTPVPREEVPEDVVERLEAERDHVTQTLSTSETDQNLYDEIDDPAVRQQLEDLGYL